MAEEEIIRRVKDKQGVFDKIQDVITGGYGTKESLREFDRRLRDYFYADFTTLRHRWEEIYLAAMNSGQNAALDHFKNVIQILDRVGERVNRADYGYAGLWDRKGSIREKELASVFNYDKALDDDLKALAKAIDELHVDSEAGKWDGVVAKVKAVKSLLLGFESKWNERKSKFRPLVM
jgi:hypothetical protein